MGRGDQMRAVSVVVRALEDLPGDVTVRLEGARPRVVFRRGERRISLQPRWIGPGFPRDLERALGDAHSGDTGADDVIVVVGERMSPGTVERLRLAHHSWADETGRIYLDVPGLLMLRDAAVRNRRQRPSAPWRWSPSAGAVAEYALVAAAPRFTIDHVPAVPLPRAVVIAEETGWSTAQVLKVLAHFDREGWTQKAGTSRGVGASRALVDPTGLISGWAAWHRERAIGATRAHATWRDPQEFLRDRLLRHIEPADYALTGWVAADRVAPFATTIPSIGVYLHPDVYDAHLTDLLQRTGLRRVESGERVQFIKAEPHVLKQKRVVDGLEIVSDIRLYGDLLRLGVRGEDSAQHLREARLGF